MGAHYMCHWTVQKQRRVKKHRKQSNKTSLPAKIEEKLRETTSKYKRASRQKNGMIRGYKNKHQTSYCKGDNTREGKTTGY